ncbi:MAG TPA: hypothetical protein EYH07_05325, partial [Kiloniellaceae bacterium]|nr:hypothetical protein [Kiloniellaceae bacterium]
MKMKHTDAADPSSLNEGKAKTSFSSASNLLGFMSNLKISTRVFGGFGLILVMLTVIGVLSIYSLNFANETFSEYRTLARQANAIGRVQANLLMTRMNVKDFIITKSEKDRDEVFHFEEKTAALIDDALTLVVDPERRTLLEGMKGRMAEYKGHFENVVALNDQRNEIVNSTLNVIGPQIEKDLTAIMESAYRDGDAEAAFTAGMVLRNLLL